MSSAPSEQVIVVTGARPHGVVGGVLAGALAAGTALAARKRE